MRNVNCLENTYLAYHGVVYMEKGEGLGLEKGLQMSTAERKM